MKIILYMAMTANGYIAKENDDTPWSDGEFNAYYDFVKKRGNIILGKKTYEIMGEENEFEKLGNPMKVIVSNSASERQNSKTVFASSPKKAIEVLKQKGFDEIVVGGGSALNGGFLKECLIDEIYLNVEPLIFGRGVKLFAETDTNIKLELLETSNLSKNTLRLHYKVLK